MTGMTRRAITRILQWCRLHQAAVRPEGCGRRWMRHKSIRVQLRLCSETTAPWRQHAGSSWLSSHTWVNIHAVVRRERSSYAAGRGGRNGTGTECSAIIRSVRPTSPPAGQSSCGPVPGAAQASRNRRCWLDKSRRSLSGKQVVTGSVAPAVIRGRRPSPVPSNAVFRPLKCHSQAGSSEENIKLHLRTNG